MVTKKLSRADGGINSSINPCPEKLTTYKKNLIHRKAVSLAAEAAEAGRITLLEKMELFHFLKERLKPMTTARIKRMEMSEAAKLWILSEEFNVNKLMLAYFNSLLSCQVIFGNKMHILALPTLKKEK